MLDPPFRPIFHSCSSLASPCRPPGTGWVIVVRARPAGQDFRAPLLPTCLLSALPDSPLSPSLAHCSFHPPRTPFLSPYPPGGHPTLKYKHLESRLCPQKFLGPCCRIPHSHSAASDSEELDARCPPPPSPPPSPAQASTPWPAQPGSVRPQPLSTGCCTISICATPLYSSTLPPAWSPVGLAGSLEPTNGSLETVCVDLL